MLDIYSLNEQLDVFKVCSWLMWKTDCSRGIVAAEDNEETGV